MGLLMSFPVADWQFWVVTVSALGSVWMLVKPFLGSRGAKDSGPCSQCGVAAGSPCQGARSRVGDVEGPARDRLVVLGDRR